MTFSQHPIWALPGIEPLLRQLWKEEMSATEIAKVLTERTKQKVTPHMVTGKARRLDLPARVSPIVIATRKATVKRYAATTGWRTEQDPDYLPKPRTGRITECAWPMNDGHPWVFCGCPTVPGKPYCQNHFNASLPEALRKSS